MASSTFRQQAVLGLYAETALHPGAESATGYVDLPVQRERHTGYPVIQGSTIKGVLRDEMKSRLRRTDKEFEAKVFAIFGSEDAQSPGTVAFGDGVLVAFPVRSTGAPFHWTTCPFALERCFRLFGETLPAKAFGELKPTKALAKEAGEALLEELHVEKVATPTLFNGSQGKPAPLARLLDLLPPEKNGFAYTRSIFLERLVILRDEDFAELVETATEVVTRIKLNALGTTTTLVGAEYGGLSDYERQGNLFVEELIPPETLFVSALRAPNDLPTDLAIPPLIRLGGDETIGRGLTHATLFTATAGGR